MRDAKEVVRQYLERAFVRHEVDRLDELVSLDALVQAARGFVSAFPDIDMKFEHTLSDEHWVAVGVSASGTHRGTFQGHAPTGKRCKPGSTTGRLPGITRRESPALAEISVARPSAPSPVGIACSA